MAVLVFDLVDSVRHMRTDEAQSILRWKSLVEYVQQVVAPAHSGRITRSLGDALMLVFHQAPQAVAAALEVQLRMGLMNRGVAGERQMQLRASVHLGEVSEGDLDIYGTAVNLAARTMSLAGPGETWVTSAVKDTLIDGVDAEVEDLGDFFLKGFDDSQRLYRLGRPGSSASVPPLQQRMVNVLRPALAVLPLNSSLGHDDQGLAGEALADELICALGRLRELHVISSLSTRGLKGRAVQMTELAKHLQVAYVVSGSYQLASGRLRLRLELADARNGQVLWSDVFAAALSDVFAADSGLVGDIVQQVASAILAREVDRAVSQPLASLESYSLLFGAMTLMHRPTRRDFERARALMEELAYRHGRDGVANAWLAKWHVLCAAQGWSADLNKEALQAQTRVAMALEADPGNALALAIGGHVKGFFSRDAVAAGRLYRDALDANPSEPLAWLYSCTWHAYRGEAHEAEEAAALALRLSPLDPMKYYFQSFAATALLAGQQAERSEALARMSIKGQRGHASTWRTLAYALVLQDKLDQAREAVQQLLAIEPSYTITAFWRRFPGRDGPMAQPWADALAKAGLPA
jgi:TolB-like protein/class 3 adenylate cyclase